MVMTLLMRRHATTTILGMINVAVAVAVCPGVEIMTHCWLGLGQQFTLLQQSMCGFRLRGAFGKYKFIDPSNYR